MNTVDPNEVIWTLAALPGFYFWIRNYLTAHRSVKLADSLGITNGRLAWARFSRSLTLLFISIETSYIVIGVNALFRVQPPAPNELSKWLTAIVLVGTSVAISLLAFRWKQLDDYLIEAARNRNTDQPPD